MELIDLLREELAKAEKKVAQLKMTIATLGDDNISVTPNRERHQVGKRFAKRKTHWRKCDKCGTTYEYKNQNSQFCRTKSCVLSRKDESALTNAIKRSPEGIRAKSKPTVLVPGDQTKIGSH